MIFNLSVPCSVGDIVYADSRYIRTKGRYYHQDGIQICEVIAIKITKTRKIMLLKPSDCLLTHERSSNRWFPISAIGKTVFLTKEEAKEKLK